MWTRILWANQKEMYLNHRRKEQKTKRDIYFEGRLVGLDIFAAKYPDKKEALSYPLPTYPLALSTAQATFYKPQRKIYLEII